jgi:hypothetical protein
MSLVGILKADDEAIQFFVILNEVKNSLQAERTGACSRCRGANESGGRFWGRQSRPRCFAVAQHDSLYTGCFPLTRFAMTNTGANPVSQQCETGLEAKKPLSQQCETCSEAKNRECTRV